jgi:hypothetical protein
MLDTPSGALPIAAAGNRFREALAIAHDFDDPARRAHLLATLGRLAVAGGAHDEADRLYRDGTAPARRTGHRENPALPLFNAGGLARLPGRARDARAGRVREY